MTEPDFHLNVNLTQRDEGVLALKPVGMVPYVLLTIEDATEGTLDLHVEVGGGASVEPKEELAAFLAVIAEAIEQGTLTPDADEDDEDTEALS